MAGAQADLVGAFQPCGSRRHALLPEGLRAYETDQRRRHADVRESLWAVSARTLDRLLAPWRVPLTCGLKEGRPLE